MFIRLTLSQYRQQDPGDLILDANQIIAVLEGKGKDDSLTCMVYCYNGMQFHVRDDNRDIQDRILRAQGEIIEE